LTKMVGLCLSRWSAPGGLRAAGPIDTPRGYAPAPVDAGSLQLAPLPPHDPPGVEIVTQTSRARAPRTLVATLLGAALLLLVSACGMDVQTARPYTPAEGVNADVGPSGEAVQVRNLMILSREDGTGYLSASIVAQERDALTAVAGQPFTPDDAAGTPFTVTLPDPVGLAPDVLVVLTDRPLIELKSPELVVGADAELTLTFSTAGDLTIRVPIVDADQPDYASISPSPTPSS
jgi:hypothetical protein